MKSQGDKKLSEPRKRKSTKVS